LFDAARLRLTLWFGGVFAVILVVIGVAVLVFTREALFDQVDDQLVARSQPVLRTLGGGPFDPGRREVLRFATAGGYFFAVTGPDGELVQGSEGAEEVEFPEFEDEDAAPRFVTATTEDGDDVRIYAEPVTGVGNQTFFFNVGRSIEPEQAALRRLLFILLAGGAAGLLLAGLSGYWLAGRALRPIKRSVEAQRTFVADASHELRTPLTLIRANAEVMKLQGARGAEAESLDDIIKETDRLSYLVGQMLTLARVDSAGTEIERERVDLGALVRDIGRQMRLLADKKEIGITTDAAAVYVQGDEQRLGELAIILIDNAIKYTNNGGRISVITGGDGRKARFVVSDDGPGIPPEALEHVFDRFYRVEKARSRETGGTGLGLAIAKWIVDAHGGAIRIDSEVGKGTVVTVEFAADVRPSGEAAVAGDTLEVRS
jgi:signal transduction histidine kinase